MRPSAAIGGALPIHSLKAVSTARTSVTPPICAEPALPPLQYVLFLPELGLYLSGVDSLGRWRTTEEHAGAWWLFDQDARDEAREVIRETGLVVELRLGSEPRP